MNTALLLSHLLFAAFPEDGKHFAITVVDEETGRGVPLVELRTVNDVRLRHRQQRRRRVPRAGPDGPRRVLPRQQPRLRVPQGRLRLSRQGAARRRPAAAPTLQDQAAQHRRAALPRHRRRHLSRQRAARRPRSADQGAAAQRPGARLRQRASTPSIAARSTGSGATPTGPLSARQLPRARRHVARCPASGGLDPDVRRRSRLLRRRPRASPSQTVQMPGTGPTWIDGAGRRWPTSRAASGCSPRYVKVEPPLKVYARGLAVFDDDKREVRARRATFDMKAAAAFPTGHAFRARRGRRRVRLLRASVSADRASGRRGVVPAHRTTTRRSPA